MNGTASLPGATGVADFAAPPKEVTLIVSHSHQTGNLD